MGEETLSPAGWINIKNAQNELVKDESLQTDFESIFDEVMLAIGQHEWKTLPFEELNISVSGPFIDEPIAYGHECISLAEGLHEDLYFSIQEWFKYRGQIAPNDRSFQFGQVLPFIQYQENVYTIDVRLQSFNSSEVEIPSQNLNLASQAIGLTQVREELALLGGERIVAKSVSGRTIQASYKNGSDFPVFISGAQHANETTGVVGSLRAAHKLNRDEKSHFVISPVENPDGYEAFHRLRSINPKHMNHAARYSALGNDIDTHSNEWPFEKELRQKVILQTKAEFHINLHGYPSHEWTRPCSGYIPQGFEYWTIPKGFFLILRYSDDAVYQNYGKEMLHQLTDKLSQLPELMAYNQKQMEAFSFHAGNENIHQINGIPCVISKVESSEFPLHLISEFPDETIYGDDFIFGHSMQSKVVLHAYQSYQDVRLKNQ